MTFPHFLRALNSRNFRLYFAGQGTSLTGNWLGITALSWLGYELSGSAFILGLLLFSSQFPTFLLAPFAGVWSDRTNRRRLLFAANIACAAQGAALAALVLSGHATVPALIILATVRGVLNGFEFPTRQSFLIEMLEHRADLPNAIALNSSMFNVARLIGPSVAGFLIVAHGPGICFIVDALSYGPLLGSLAAMRLGPQTSPRIPGHPLADLRDGLHHVLARPALRHALLLVACTAFFGFAATVLSPVLARDVFGGDARVLGKFYAATGGGALLSALFLGTRPSALGLGSWIRRGAVLIVAALLGCALSTSLWLAIACMMINGMGVVLVMAGNNTLIQSQVDDDKRGRIMGLFVMCQGMFPFGSLAVGGLAQAAGPRTAIALCAAVMATAAWRFSRDPDSANAETGTVTPAPEPPPPT